MSTKISQLTSATNVTASDFIQIVDVEDGVMASSGTNKKATAQLVANNLAKIINDGAVITANTSTDAVRITQTGSGNALVVEDSTNPDTTPFVITSTGALGIGTTDPETKLDVYGALISRCDNNGYAFFAPKNGTLPFASDYDRFEIRVMTDSQLAILGNTHGGSGQARDLAFLSGGQERLRIASGGNVGIGITTPSSKLHVVGDLTMSSATVATSATAGANGDVPAQVAGYLVVNINGTARKIPYYA